MKSHAQILCVMTTLLLSSLPASAQTYNNSAGAPIFSIPNFTGDARYDDLYIYMHEQPHEQWNTYRQRLEAAAGQIVNQQPLQQSPSPENPGPGSPFYQGVPVVGGMQTQQSSAGNSQATQAAMANQEPQVTTSVSGAVLAPGTAGPPVPGLVEP